MHDYSHKYSCKVVPVWLLLQFLPKLSTTLNFCMNYVRMIINNLLPNQEYYLFLPEFTYTTVMNSDIDINRKSALYSEKKTKN